jgi:glycosyltransferase involved in cell wall biosynthesis
MKILIVSHYFLPHVGGIEIVADSQAKELVKKGHNITILATDSSTSNTISNSINVVKVKAYNFLEKIFGIPFPIPTLHSIFSFKKLVQQNDIICIHGHVYFTSLIASFFARKYQKPVVLIQHNSYIKYDKWIFRTLEHIADQLIGKYTLNNAKNIVSVSNETKKYIESIIGKNPKIITIYNGIDQKKYASNLSKENSKSELGSNNKFLCLCVRRITFKNGVDTILKVAEKTKENDHIQYIIAGTGADFEKVKNIISEKKLTNIQLLGFVPDNLLTIYFQASDLFILPSKTGEGLPMVVLEAFASGLPVIATKSGGHTEIIKSGSTGYLTDVDDFEQISKYVVSLYSSKSKLEMMSKNCSQLIQSQFSWEKNVNQLLSFL